MPMLFLLLLVAGVALLFTPLKAIAVGFLAVLGGLAAIPLSITLIVAGIVWYNRPKAKQRRRVKKGLKALPKGDLGNAARFVREHALAMVGRIRGSAAPLKPWFDPETGLQVFIELSAIRLTVRIRRDGNDIIALTMDTYRAKTPDDIVVSMTASPAALNASDAAKKTLARLLREAVSRILPAAEVNDGQSEKADDVVFGAKRQAPADEGEIAMLRSFAREMSAAARTSADGEMRGALERIARSAEAMAESLEAKPALLRHAWDALDYMIPKTREILNGYAELQHAPSLSGEERKALADVRDGLLALPTTFEQDLRALRADKVADLVSRHEALKTVSAVRGRD